MTLEWLFLMCLCFLLQTTREDQTRLFFYSPDSIDLAFFELTCARLTSRSFLFSSLMKTSGFSHFTRSMSETKHTPSELHHHPPCLEGDADDLSSCQDSLTHFSTILTWLNSVRLIDWSFALVWSSKMWKTNALSTTRLYASIPIGFLRGNQAKTINIASLAATVQHREREKWTLKSRSVDRRVCVEENRSIACNRQWRCWLVTTHTSISHDFFTHRVRDRAQSRQIKLSHRHTHRDCSKLVSLSMSRTLTFAHLERIVCGLLWRVDVC